MEFHKRMCTMREQFRFYYHIPLQGRYISMHWLSDADFQLPRLPHTHIPLYARTSAVRSEFPHPEQSETTHDIRQQIIGILFFHQRPFPHLTASLSITPRRGFDF